MELLTQIAQYEYSTRENERQNVKTTADFASTVRRDATRTRRGPDDRGQHDIRSTSRLFRSAHIPCFYTFLFSCQLPAHILLYVSPPH